MNRKLLNGLLVLAVAAGGVGTFTSCKDEDFRNDMQIQEASLEAQIKAIREMSDADFANALQKWLDGQTALLSQGMNPQFQNYKDLLAAASTMKYLYDEIMNANGPLSGAAEQFASNLWEYYYKGKVEAITNNLQSQITANKTKIDGVWDQINGEGGIIDQIADLLQQVEGLDGQINGVGGILERLGAVEEDIDDLMEKQGIMDEELQALITNYVAYQMYVNEVLQNLLKRASSVSISQTYNPVLGSLNLPANVNSMILASYEYYSDENWAGDKFPMNALDHMADSSPFNLEGYNKAQWATILETVAAAKSESLPEGVDFSAAQNFQGQELGNMGGAIVTINPASVDFTQPGYKVELVNSKMESVLVGELTNFDGLLSFGGSRAGEANGVYALNVNATPDNYTNLLVDLKKSDLKDAVKQAIDNKTIANFAHLGSTVFRALNNKLPAYAVKVSWEENDNNANPGIYESPVAGDAPATKATSENYVLSDFDLAAVVARPLSYGTEIDHYIPSGKHIPEKISALSYYLNKINNKLANIHIDEISGINTNINIDLEVYIDTATGTVWAKDANGQDVLVGTYDKDGIQATQDALNDLVNGILEGANVELESSIKKDIVGQLNQSIEDINVQIRRLQGKMDKYLNRLEEAQENHKDLIKYADRLIDLYNQVASKVNDFLADPNKYLQVMMAYSTGDGPHHLSTDPRDPTHFTYNPSLGQDQGFTLYATSYTGDVIVPSYKKWVAFTTMQFDENEWDPSKWTVLGDTYNGGENAAWLNAVLPGNVFSIPVKVTSDMAMNSGKTMTVTYVSVDYHGNTSAQNYYIVIDKVED